jgi:hypothetical protein
VFGVFAFAASAQVAAQENVGRITGKIVDASHGTALQGAMMETVGLAVPLKATTGIDGRFTCCTIARRST